MSEQPSQNEEYPCTRRSPDDDSALLPLDGLTEAASYFRYVLHEGRARRNKRKCRIKDLVDIGELVHLWEPHPDDPSWLWKDVTLADVQGEGKPPCGWGDTHCKQVPGEDKTCHAHQLLPRVFLPSLKRLVEPEETLWTTLILHDEIAKHYTFRTFSHFAREDPNYGPFLMLYRISEASYGNEEIFGELAMDFSGEIIGAGDGEPNYVFILNPAPHGKTNRDSSTDVQRELPGVGQVYDVSSIIAALNADGRPPKIRLDLLDLLKQHDAAKIYQRLSTLLCDPVVWKAREERRTQWEHEEEYRREAHSERDTLVEPPYDPGNEYTRTKDVDEAIAFLTQKVGGVLKQHMFDSDSELPSAVRECIEETVGHYGLESRLPTYRDRKYSRSGLVRLANYFVWLGALHPDLGSYMVKFVSKFRPDITKDGDTDPDTIENKQDALKVLEPSALVFASRKEPSRALSAYAEEC